MTLTPVIRRTLCSEIKNYTDCDAFVSDLSLSSIWGDSPDADIPTDRVVMLRNFWADTHCTITDLLERYNMRIIDFSAYFDIPYRTVQHWCYGARQCPPYVVAMAAEILRLNNTSL